MPSEEAPRASVKVAYVAGWFRSGSTVLGQTLGSVPDFVFGGELRYYWREVANEAFCSCGWGYGRCPAWEPVVRRLHERGWNERDVAALDRRLLTTRRLPELLAARRGRGPAAAPLAAYLGGLGELYRALGSVSGARVVVDTSKAPTYLLALDAIPHVDVHVVHLVRDPRATAYSRIRNPTDVDLGVVPSSLLWSAWNIVAARAARSGRYLLVRYEDFARSPVETVRRIVELLDEQPERLPFVDRHTLRLEPTHSVAGNAVRASSGVVPVVPDERWRTELDRPTRAVVGALTLPLRHRYGY